MFVLITVIDSGSSRSYQEHVLLGFLLACLFVKYLEQLAAMHLIGIISDNDSDSDDSGSLFCRESLKSSRYHFIT